VFRRQRYWLQPSEAFSPQSVADRLNRLEKQPKSLENAVAPTLPDPTGPANSSILQRLRSAPVDRRSELLKEFIQAQAAAVLGHAVDAVPRTKGFTDLGMDSLASFELRKGLEDALDCRLPTTITFDYPNVDALSTHLLKVILNFPIREVAVVETAEANVEADLEGLSRDELAAMLAAELSHVEKGKSP
jgi:acyl carrier protein